ncbi:MAG: outer membrane protein assembly factor BamB [Gammaproteobacteria bacterium]|nr:MAG: outer membrane protein assembly factor BamB [Gammaproteobacteria bacterium]
MRIVAVLFVAITLVACGTSKELEPPTPLSKIDQSVDTHKLWSSSLPSKAKKSFARLKLAVANDIIFAATESGYVGAFSRDTGQKIWRVDTKLRLDGGVGIGESHVYVGSYEGDVLALNRDSGEIAWQTNVASEVLAAPQEDNGVVVVPTADGHLYGHRSDNGQRIWTHQRQTPALILQGGSAPVPLGDRVLAGFASGHLDMLNIADGKLEWSVTAGVPHGRTELERIVDIDSDLLVDNDIIYVASYQGRVSALDVESGRPIWSRDMSSYAGLALDDDAIYVSDADDKVWALDRSTGATLWTQDKLQRRSITGPALQGDYVVVGDFDGYIHWLSKVDGSFVSRRRVAGKGVLSTPIVADDILFVLGKNGSISAIQLRSAS